MKLTPEQIEALVADAQSFLTVRPRDPLEVVGVLSTILEYAAKSAITAQLEPEKRSKHYAAYAKWLCSSMACMRNMLESLEVDPMVLNPLPKAP